MTAFGGKPHLAAAENGSADPNPTTNEWRVVDSYGTGGGVADSWRAVGPWRSTEAEARLDAEHGSRGLRWLQIDNDTAFATPFGTIRVCRACGCLVAGGPTICGRCAESDHG